MPLGPKIIISGPLFTKRKDLVKFRSRDIVFYDVRIGLIFDRRLGSAAAQVPVKLQSDEKSPNPTHAALRLHEI